MEKQCIDHSQAQSKVHRVWRKKEARGDGEREVGRQQWGRKQFDRRERTRYEGSGAPKIIYHRKNNLAEVCYNVSEEEIQKYEKLYIGTVRTPGTTYYVQEWFHMQGFFSIKFTPMGANKVVMEEMEDGVFQELLTNYKERFYEKFDDIRIWEPDIVDNERVVWVRCHGIPLHAWNDEFFASLARNFGEYLGVDDATRTKSAMDIARIRLRSNGYDVFNAVVTTNINGSLFHIKMTEEWCGPLQWMDNSCCKKADVGIYSDSDDSEGEVPPLFSAADGWCSSYEEERENGKEGSEKEEETPKEFHDETVVQETVDVSNVERRDNDCVKGGIEHDIGVGVGNIIGVSGGELNGREGKQIEEEENVPITEKGGS